VLLCVLFLYFYIYITNCISVFSKFYTWLRVRGTALRLAKAPEFFLLFYVRVFYMFTLAGRNEIRMQHTARKMSLPKS